MLVADIRNPEKQPIVFKRDSKKYKRQKERQKRKEWSSVLRRES